MKPTTLTIGTYNIRNADGGKSLQGIADEISAAGLDIIGIQEADVGVPRSQRLDIPRELAKLSGMSHVQFMESIELDGGLYGNCVLSRFPIVSCTRHFLESGNDEQRAVLHCVIDTPFGRLDFFNTHLSLFPSLRARQFVQLNALLAQHRPFILTGDFNIGGFGEYDALDDVVCANNAQTPFGTFENGDPIDNIIVSEGWTVREVRMSVSPYSDHSMLTGVVGG